MKLLVAAAIALATAGPALAQGSEAEFRATTLDLSAAGEVRVEPDLAVITAGVQTQAATAADALARNRDQMNAAIAALERQGVPAADIQTSSLNLQPQYVYAEGKPRRLTGYQADNEVTARLHDLKALGRTVDALVAAGADQINGIGFERADRTSAEDAARQAAVKALQAKAALYAAASGYRVGRLVSLSEGGASSPQPLRPMLAMRTAAAAPTPVEPGELTVRETVSAEYELTR